MKDDVAAQIIEALVGYSHGEMSVCDRFNVSLEDIEEMMADRGYERCGVCGTWCETSELVDEFDEVAPCEQCRK